MQGSGSENCDLGSFLAWELYRSYWTDKIFWCSDISVSGPRIFYCDIAGPVFDGVWLAPWADAFLLVFLFVSFSFIFFFLPWVVVFGWGLRIDSALTLSQPCTDHSLLLLIIIIIVSWSEIISKFSSVWKEHYFLAPMSLLWRLDASVLFLVVMALWSWSNGCQLHYWSHLPWLYAARPSTACKDRAVLTLTERDPTKLWLSSYIYSMTDIHGVKE